eukprot:gene56891-biopygen38463
MQFFGGSFCGLDASDVRAAEDDNNQSSTHCDGLPRQHYDNLNMAIVTSFQIMSGEDWQFVMYDGMRAAGSPWCIYYLIYYTVGTYLILNLFIAVLLNNRNEEANAELEDALSEDEDIDKYIPQSPRKAAAEVDVLALREYLDAHGIPERVVEMLEAAEMDGRSFMRFDRQT